MFSKSSLPDELMMIVKKAISESGLPGDLFNRTVPVSIDDDELEKVLKKQSTQEHTTIAESIKKKADRLGKLPEKLQELSDRLVLFDFISGISSYISETNSYPLLSNEMAISNSSNLFLDKAQPISFHLNEKNKCSILTGANSGGKTTLLEHIIQVISLIQIGLPVRGEVKMPLFTDIYYFAKNKGSVNKGAFETLLTQMSKIKPGKKTLILADEIESVTEPGVAGAIVSASAEYFIKQGCFMVVATHLGKEIQKKLPENARIDGIEAKGLDEFYELIVDHNPVLGRLANSTPELIIEKMANSFKTDYFNYLHNFIKKDKQNS
jgi:dsDNA-specific endonuclease/ATPase MutS2